MPASICSPSSVCVCIRRASATVSGPGLSRISSGMPILPTSCSRKPYSALGSSSELGRRPRAARSRSAAPAASARACPCPSTRAPRRGRPIVSRYAFCEQPSLPALELEQVAKVARVEQELLLVGRGARRGDGAVRTPAARSTTPSSSSGRNGLRRNASAPAGGGRGGGVVSRSGGGPGWWLSAGRLQPRGRARARRCRASRCRERPRPGRAGDRGLAPRGASSASSSSTSSDSSVVAGVPQPRLVVDKQQRITLLLVALASLVQSPHEGSRMPPGDYAVVVEAAAALAAEAARLHVLGAAAGTARASVAEAGSSTSMIATHVSRPIRSASASGPIGWLKPSFAIVSIASGSATPRAAPTPPR